LRRRDAEDIDDLHKKILTPDLRERISKSQKLESTKRQAVQNARGESEGIKQMAKPE